MRKHPAIFVGLALLALGGFGVSYALSAGETTGTVTASIPDQVVTIPGTATVATYTIPTVTETVTVTTPTEPPPPPPPPSSYPPTAFAVHHAWIGIDGTDAFDYRLGSTLMDDLIAHGPDTWTTQGAPFKAQQSNGHALFYNGFGVAGSGINTVLSEAAARASGFLAHHNGTEIANPYGGAAKVVDLGKPGVCAAYAAALSAKWGTNGWDGVFADDVNGWFNLWALGKSIDGYTSPDDWVTRAVLPLISCVHASLPGILIPNIGEWANHPQLRVIEDAASGALNEFFLTWGNGVAQPPATIEGEYSSLRHSIDLGKTYFGIVHRIDGQGLRYAFCAGAIFAGDHPELFRLSAQTAYGSQALTWDAVFARLFVMPLSDAQHVAGTPTWSRAFADGSVLTIDTNAETCSGL
jgi:hypothetical protein